MSCNQRNTNHDLHKQTQYNIFSKLALRVRNFRRGMNLRGARWTRRWWGSVIREHGYDFFNNSSRQVLTKVWPPCGRNTSLRGEQSCWARKQDRTLHFLSAFKLVARKTCNNVAGKCRAAGFEQWCYGSIFRKKKSDLTRFAQLFLIPPALPVTVW